MYPTITQVKSYGFVVSSYVCRGDSTSRVFFTSKFGIVCRGLFVRFTNFGASRVMLHLQNWHCKKDWVSDVGKAKKIDH